MTYSGLPRPSGHNTASLSSTVQRLSASRTAKRWAYTAACLTAATVAPGADAAWAGGPPEAGLGISEAAAATPTAIASPASQEVVTIAPPEAIDLTEALDLVAQTAAPPNSASDSAPNGTPNSAETRENRPEAFGARGSDRWYIQSGAATTFDNEFALVGVGASHFFAKGHSINAELNGMAFSQDGDDAVGANLNLLLRYHFVRQENWSLYVDGGAGILGTTDNVPSGGSSFNFTPQAGGGATIRLSDEERLMVGLRWHHISNANTFDSNPGRDSVMGYVGLNLPR